MDADKIFKRLQERREELLELSATELDSGDEEMIELASGASLDRSPRDNWVDKDKKGLPRYIREIARALERDGMPLSRAIPVAISRVRKWSRGGDNVNADTVAKSLKALSEWEALKARNRARKG